jgi:hypothetical protein
LIIAVEFGDTGGAPIAGQGKITAAATGYENEGANRGADPSTTTQERVHESRPLS